jgi:hypothetical protein
MAHDLDRPVLDHPLVPSRRSLVGGLAGATALAFTGLHAGPAAAHGTITSYPGVGGVPTFYINLNDLASFGYRPSFHDQMGQWMDFWAANVPSSFGAAHRVGCLGVHTDHRPTAAHNSGRGFDLTHIHTKTSGGNSVRRFYARRDIWMNWAEADKAAERRRYWATAASVHRYFRDVLTYGSHPSDHSNHIHIDNLVASPSTVGFSTGSKAQIRAAQEICRWVWGLPTTLDSIWGSETASHTSRVIRAAGGSGSLTGAPRTNWLLFTRASMREGYGTQSYPAP